MASLLNSQQGQKKIQNFSVETVRNLLKIDNKGIAKLCAQVSMMPKKDQYGRTYFSKDDVELLRRVKSLQAQSKEEKRTHVSVPLKSINPMNNNPVINVPVAKTSSTAAVDRICTSIASMEDNLTDRMSKLLDEKLSEKLDEKLDGMDEVVVELVRCKTENETLRYKMNELNKEVYNLKNELSRYKTLGFGLYVKKSGDSSLI